MKYNGIELEPITKPQVFNPPKEMLVWDNVFCEPHIELVWGIAPANFEFPIRCVGNGYYQNCAEIPEKTKRATNLQLVEWLAKGNGVFKNKGGDTMCVNLYLPESKADIEVDENYVIRPFGTTEWIEPTLENMGMEDE